ncbi:MAG: EpsG family protein [Prevotellaceae bacterium]|nr:EpsG family protein [Prevotellaceae bacterium]MDY3365235.1 EpsG family protein [Prevotella sp.]
MAVYILLALVICWAALQENGHITKTTKLFFNVGLIVFLLVVGLRYMHGDYPTYQMGYERGLDVGNDEGYYQLQLLFRGWGFSFQTFIFVITLFSVFAFRQAFRVSLWPSFGLAMILGKIFTLYAMSGIRQYIALALAWWAISELLIYKRRIVFFALLFLAYTMHGSALILLPIYFFRNRSFSYSIAILMILGAIMIGRTYMNFFEGAAAYSDLVDQRMSAYLEGTKLGGEGMNALNYIENFVFLIAAVLVRKKVVDKIPYYDFFLYMYLIYCGLLIAGSEIGIIKRLRDYYALSYAIIVPATAYFFKNNATRRYIYAIFVIYFIFLMFRSLFVYDSPFDADAYNRMVPYHSIFEKTEQ